VLLDWKPVRQSHTRIAIRDPNPEIPNPKILAVYANPELATSQARDFRIGYICKQRAAAYIHLLQQFT